MRALQQIAETAEQLKVNLAVEFIWNGFLFSPLEMKHFLDEVGSPYIGFYFDPGNMAVFQFPHHWVRLTGEHIKMVHVKDWKGGALKGSWTPLLEGEVDFGAMNRELRLVGYDGPLISEVPPYARLVQRHGCGDSENHPDGVGQISEGKAPKSQSLVLPLCASPLASPIRSRDRS